MQQNELQFTKRGGVRPGAGRKRTVSSRVAHRPRPRHAARHPLHVTMKLAKGLPSLRERDAHRLLRVALLGGSDRFGARVVQYCAQSNHLHMICEAQDAHALGRAMKGLAVRLSRGLNRLWNRTGAVFADRYHARPLRTPREVRHALAYVLGNARKHGLRLATVLDTFSSAASLDGWIEHGPLRAPWLARATTWLLSIGWRRHGLLSVLPPRPT